MRQTEPSTTGAGHAAAALLDREPQDLAARFQEVRRFTERLCEPLETEDYVIQSMPDVSPTKWHLAHTSWFFETFLLSKQLSGYRPFHPQFSFLFNSYYNAVGERHARPHRGLLSRPSVVEVYRYRAHVDQAMRVLLEGAAGSRLATLASLLELGLHHEQQHQELILTDIKHVLSCNPLKPAYREASSPVFRNTHRDGQDEQDGRGGPVPFGHPVHPVHPCEFSGSPERLTLEWLAFDDGLRWIGHDGEGFAFDNEGPRHQVFLQPFELACRLVTNEEYRAFIEDGGYQRPELWLSEGWNTVTTHGWAAPLYWEKRKGEWWMMTLSGMREVVPDEPVCHVSYYEADAYARWSGARLPREAEWEVAGSAVPITGNFAEDGHFHPIPEASDGAGGSLRQLFGDVWEWTGSAYSPYPGYRPLEGALGEYNGKFMCGQIILRGGSCATSRSHIRPTYRNFFPPDARWQFTGIRLARDAG